MLTKEQKGKIFALIDRGTWKHSWHLEKNKYGNVDFYDSEINLKDCLKIAEEATVRATNLLALAGEVKVFLIGELLDWETRKKEEAELATEG